MADPNVITLLEERPNTVRLSINGEEIFAPTTAIEHPDPPSGEAADFE